MISATTVCQLLKQGAIHLIYDYYTAQLEIFIV